jgi:ankyrin repeat protein
MMHNVNGNVSMQSRRNWICCVTIVVFVIGCGDTSLNRAIQRGDSATVEQLCKSGTDVNRRGLKYRTGLHTAILAGKKELYTLLLDNKADPNLCDVDGSSVMHLAAEQDDVFWIREALAHGGNPNQLNTGNRFYPDATPILYALAKERTGPALELIKGGADVNHRAKTGMRPFSAACLSNCFEVAYKLMDAGADPRLTKVLGNMNWDEDVGSDSNLIDGPEIDREKKWQKKLCRRLHDEGYLKNGNPVSQ